MNKYLIQIIFFIITILYFNLGIGEENKILFKISNKSFTTIDYEKRKKYLLFVGDNYDLDQSEILKDFISANIFYEFYINTNNNINFQEKIIQIYNDILVNKEQDASFNKENYNKNNIFYNLELDLIRKTILEEFLSSKKNKIFDNNDDINLIYNFKIKYLNIYIDQVENYKDELQINNFKNINEIENFLNQKKIKYFKNEKEINNVNNINKKIKENIMSKNNFFIIENNNLISFISINKKFETYDGLQANIYSVESKEKLDKDILNCEKIKNNTNYKIINKEYEYIKLNDTIRNNLIDINNYIEFINENKFTYVLLCGIKFNKELLNNININKKINTTVNKLEDNFIKKYSKQYNLIILDE